ncbi:MAG: ferritin family protein [Candidatus Heimdallarchaeota archaeon]
MEAQMENLRNFFREQIKLENKIVDLAEANAKATDNILISELIRGIALDSIKHGSMLSAAIELISGSTPLIEEQQMEDLGDHIKEHIKLEEEAIRTYKEQLKTVKDERIRLILQYLVRDEQRHHALLTQIDRWIIQPQALTEDNLWEMYWKYAPFHGSPGG